MDKREFIEDLIAWGSWVIIAFALFVIGGM